MEHLKQIQRAIDYVEDHLEEDLSVDSISKVAGFSKWHFQMVFSSIVGDTFKEYVRKRRLTAALISIGTSDRRILDIALDAGFESQEAFTRAFKTMFNKTPGECRKEGTKSVMYLNKLKVTIEYLDHLYGGINMQPVLQMIDAKIVIGMQTRFISALSPDHDNHIKIPELWRRYGPRGHEISARLSEADMGVVVCLKDDEVKQHPNEMLYMACAEVSGQNSIPAGMTAMTIPKGEYAVFTHKGPIEKMNMTMKYIYGSWLPKSGRKLREGPEIEIYDQRFKPGSEESEMDILIPLETR